MSNELARYAGGMPANPEDLEKGLQNVQSTIQTSGGFSYLRLMKSGLFVYGQENIEVEEGSEWAVNPYSIQHGYVCWTDHKNKPNEILDERMVPFTQPPPNAAELPDMGFEWKHQIAVVLQCISGEDQGTTVLYKGTSTGLRNACKDLINSILEQLQTDKEHIVPVVTLDSDSYQHKVHGQIFYPVIEVHDWLGMDGIKEYDEDDAQDPEAEPTTEDAQPEAEPAPRRRRAGKTSKAAAKDEGKPAGNRRRRRRAS
jgi:hypothetical protein